MSGKPINTWWGPPKKFSDRKNERKISWLELFYDLVYVAAIGQLTQHLPDCLLNKGFSEIRIPGIQFCQGIRTGILKFDKI